ncbi:MAG: H/ACA RNA-protein complex protein Gar1 [Euryarchaeota archaeon]|nr:H/ACA RNA-protein complex protein Gar1 [Euryarchaeota archaeon]
MKKLGVVENIAYDGSVLVRAAFAPAPGARVVDKRERPVGKVVRVFGPVAEPFASVRAEGKASLSLLGSDVYVREGNHAEQADRRGRRGH